MENFVYQSPTKIIFGKGTEAEVGKEVKRFADKILMVYYEDQIIKKIGLYDKVIKSLKDEKIEIFELGKVKPNPVLSTVYEGIKICRDNNIAFMLAVGGGSVIDTAKAISIGVKYNGDVWDFYSDSYQTGKKPKEYLQVGVILTIPAAGSETSWASVITKEEGQLKRFFADDKLRPVFAILNPEITFTLPTNQTLNGISDMISHNLERYFTVQKGIDATDRFLESAIKSLMKNAYIVLEKPQDYDARAEIMWLGLLSMNGILAQGRIEDWASHMIEHEISGIYDTVAHGAGLSIVTPAWMKYVYKHDVNKFAQFAIRVFGADINFGKEESIALEGIRRLENFYKEVGLPVKLSELKNVNITDSSLDEMAKKCTNGGPVGSFVKLDKKDCLNILKLAAK